MVPEPVRVHLHAALPAAPLDHLVDPAGGQRATAIDPEPQPRPVRLRMPCPDPQVPVDAAGSLAVDLHDPLLAALPPDPYLPAVQIQVAVVRVARVVADPG